MKISKQQIGEFEQKVSKAVGEMYGAYGILKDSDTIELGQPDKVVGTDLIRIHATLEFDLIFSAKKTETGDHECRLISEDQL